VAKNKLIILVKKTPGKVKLDKHLRAYIANYLNELNKNYEQTQREKKAPKETDILKPQIRGLDYQSESQQGQITLHGYLRQAFIEMHSCLPEDCPASELPSKLAQTVHSSSHTYGNAKRGDIVGSKLIFALSPETTESWKAAGIDIDSYLRIVVERTFDRYKQAAQGGADLGYAVGIHHDRNHFHAHIILLNHDTEGKALRLSNRLKVKNQLGQEERVDFLNLLTGTANLVTKELQQGIQQPNLKIAFADQLGADFERWLELAAYDRITTTNRLPGENDYLISSEKERLREAPIAELLQAIDLSYKKRLDLFKQCQTLAKTKEGLELLFTKEQDILQSGKVTSISKKNAQANEKQIRNQLFQTLKQQKEELKIINEVNKLIRTRKTINKQTLWDTSIRMHENCKNLERYSPGISQVVKGVLAAIDLETNAKTDKRLIKDYRNEVQEAANKLKHWKLLRERELNSNKEELTNLTKQKTLVTKSVYTKEENISSLLYIFKAAQESKTPSLLQRYQRVRTNVQLDNTLSISRMNSDPQSSNSSNTATGTNPAAPRFQGFRLY
jgi:hypothetical protein